MVFNVAVEVIRTVITVLAVLLLAFIAPSEAAGLSAILFNVVFSLLSAVVGGIIGGLIQAAFFNFSANTRFVNGWNVFIDSPPSFFSSAGKPAWVKFRLQGAVNTGKLMGLPLFLIGIPLGIIASLILVLALPFLPQSTQSMLSPLAYTAFILAPIVLGGIGFIGGALHAVFSNFSRQLNFVNGIDLLVAPPSEIEKVPGALQGWAKVLRLGAMNYGKWSAASAALVGLVGVPIGIFFLASGAGTSPDASFAGNLFGAIMLFLPILFFIAGFAIGAVSAALYNFAFGLNFVNGLDVKVEWPGAEEKRKIAVPPTSKSVSLRRVRRAK